MLSPGAATSPDPQGGPVTGRAADRDAVRKRDTIRWYRHLALAVGLVVLAVLWFSPLPDSATTAFPAHMLLFAGIVAVAAPLISVWLAGSRGILGRGAQSMLSPIPAAVFEFIVVWGWHTPMLHQLAALTPAVFAIEQASFLLAGVLLWTSALQPSPAGRGGAGVLALLLTCMQMTLLGTLLALSSRPLYTHVIHSVGDVYAQLAEQRAGGMLMLIGAGLPYLAGGLLLIGRLLREPVSPVTGFRPSPTNGLR